MDRRDILKAVLEIGDRSWKFGYIFRRTPNFELPTPVCAAWGKIPNGFMGKNIGPIITRIIQRLEH